MTYPQIPNHSLGMHVYTGFEVQTYRATTLSRPDHTDDTALLRAYELAAKLFQCSDTDAAELHVKDNDRTSESMRRLARIAIVDYGYSEFHILRLKTYEAQNAVLVSNLADTLRGITIGVQPGERNVILADLTAPDDLSEDLESVISETATQIESFASRKLRVGLILPRVNQSPVSPQVPSLLLDYDEFHRADSPSL